MKIITKLLLIVFLLTSCFKKDDMIQPYPPIKDIENNDTFDKAIDIINATEPIVGFYNKGEKQDIDFYNINLSGQKGSFRFTLTGVPNVDARVSVYDNDRSLLFVMDQTKIGEAEVAWRYYTAHSLLYISIEAKSGSNEVVPYIFTIVSEEKDSWVEKEPNNTVEEATFIELGTVLKGYIVPSDDVDYYEIVFNNDGITDFQVKAESLSGLDLSLEIINMEDMTSDIINKSAWGGTEISQRYGSDKGKFIIKVTGRILDYNKEPLYYLSVEELKNNYYEREFNGTIEKATRLILREDMIGTIEENDTDIFSIDVLSKADHVNISLEGIADRKFSISLLDDSGTSLYSSNGQSNNSIKDCKPGRYYIEIKRQVPGSYLYTLYYSID